MPNDTTNQADTLLNIESLVKSYYQRLNSLTLEVRQLKEMMDSTLNNDSEYHENDLAAKKSTKLRTIARQKLLNVSANADLFDKIKDHQAQLRELKIGPSEYLTQYMALSGTNKIESVDGAILEIVTNAKLVKKKE